MIIAYNLVQDLLAGISSDLNPFSPLACYFARRIPKVAFKMKILDDFVGSCSVLASFSHVKNDYCVTESNN